MTSSPSLTARVAEYGNKRSHCWREKKLGRPARQESNTLSGQTYDTVYEKVQHQHLHLAVSRAQTVQDGLVGRQLREMKERLRPDNEVDIDDTEPTKKAKDLEKSPYMELTPA